MKQLTEQLRKDLMDNPAFEQRGLAQGRTSAAIATALAQPIPVRRAQEAPVQRVKAVSLRDRYHLPTGL